MTRLQELARQLGHRDQAMLDASEEIRRLACDAIDYLDRNQPKPAAAIERLRLVIREAQALEKEARK